MGKQPFYPFCDHTYHIAMCSIWQMIAFSEINKQIALILQRTSLEAACSMYVRCPLEPVQKLYSIFPFPWCKVLKQSWLKRLTFCMHFNFACFYHTAVCFKLNFVKTKSVIRNCLTFCQA